jgi:hypothetical protein
MITNNNELKKEMMRIIAVSSFLWTDDIFFTFFSTNQHSAISQALFMKHVLELRWYEAKSIIFNHSSVIIDHVSLFVSLSTSFSLICTVTFKKIYYNM